MHISYPQDQAARPAGMLSPRERRGSAAGLLQRSALPGNSRQTTQRFAPKTTSKHAKPKTAETADSCRFPPIPADSGNIENRGNRRFSPIPADFGSEKNAALVDSIFSGVELNLRTEHSCFLLSSGQPGSGQRHSGLISHISTSSFPHSSTRPWKMIPSTASVYRTCTKKLVFRD